MTADPNDEFVVPPALERGDRVAVVAPASNLYEEFPYVHELGLERLREVFDLEPVEYPTARTGSDWLYDNPEARAEDVMDAFRDPDIGGVVATIGGNDQVRIVAHLDPEVLRENPTRFYGWSDNTALALYLWNLGIVSFYGGSLLTEYAMHGEMFPYTVEYLERALFSDSLGEVRPAERFTDEPNRWAEGPEVLETPRETEPNPGWRFEGSDRAVEGRVWGGCWGIVDEWFLLDRYVPDRDRLAGTVLAIETSEGRPDPGHIAGQLRALGERGVLEAFDGVLVGRAVTRSYKENPPAEERREYRERQREVFVEAFAEYNPDAPVVLDLDFGHTYPTVPVPIGGRVRIDPGEERVVFR
ncbi:LD-carboxypeptidase [Halobacteriales archaeon QS_8_69_26]|nr:MAG: LD-carboxypeptidase [Halobacteriales archaeon QS_8_69_26]